MTTLRDIANCLGQKDAQLVPETPITELAIDSRKVQQPAQALFFAIRGEQHDGHRFIPELYARGVRAFICEFPLPDSGGQGSGEGSAERFPDATFLTLESSIVALQQVAAAHRAQFSFPVVGITGSNGKTIVKEWLHQLLSPDLRIVRSPKSYNSQVGVPLSVWAMTEENEMAIFEAGISKVGEMVRLEAVIRPTIGILTNIGHAHDEGFSNLAEKTREKLALFKRCETLIVCSDHQIIYNELEKVSFEQRPRIVRWGRNEDADIRITEVTHGPGTTTVNAVFSGSEVEITIPFSDAASLENAMHCWAFMLLRGMDDAVIAERMLRLTPVEMRLEMKQGINGCAIINDYYNSDLQSIAIALDFLAQQQQQAKRTVILSDILQSGRADSDLYREVATMLQQRKVDRLIGIGPRISSQADMFPKGSIFYPDTATFLTGIGSLQFRDETILLKGARPFGFEAISRRLEQKSHHTVLEIDLGAIVHNLNVIRGLLRPTTKVMAMVKAAGYGSGSAEIARVLEFHRVNCLAVAYVDEGIELRKAGITLPIMVMSPEERSFDAMLRHGLEPEIYSFRALDGLQSTIRQMSWTAPVRIHIKLNTGMNRLGFGKEDVGELSDRLAADGQLEVASIFSHLAASENPKEDDFTRQQISLFETMSTRLKERLGKVIPRHICNSFGILRFPEAQFDMVRLGIGLYGVAPDSPVTHQLRQVSSLCSSISQIHHLQAGDTVGYGRLERATAPMVTATIPIGYADGLSRRHGNRKGHIMVQGRPAPIIGSVCMDMVMVDVTGIPCQEGEEVIIFGEGYPITDFARNAETIPYEVLTGISGRVKRVYFQE
jgi:Alr-MurF fusion protein